MALDIMQKSALASWIREGVTLSEAQKRIESEFGIRLTYMEVRFIVDDLDLELQSAGPAFTEPLRNEPPAAPGKVRVSLDKIRRPNALLSGSVVFSDGHAAQWQLDQMGRFTMNPSTPGYQPTQDDMMAFQSELQTVAEQAGLY
jgi:hypothetical protein